jgi:hypothetical protein
MNDDLFFLNDELESVEMNTSYEPLPAGNYDVVVVGSEVKENNNRNGSYLQLTLEVVAPRFQGRKIWERLNYKNPNPQAEEIGKRTLKTIMALCGIPKIQSADQFLGHTLPVQVSVKARKDKPDEFENQLRFSPPKGFNEQAVARPAAPQGAVGAPAPAAASGAKPWQKARTAA